MLNDELSNRIVIKGQGTPIVLIHGMGGPRVWEPIVEVLAKEYKVIIPTFPGYLGGEGVIEYNDKLYVEFLEQVRLQLGIEKWNVVGLSMGGRTAINYVLDYNKYVSSMVVIDSIGIGYMFPFVRIPILKTVFPKILYKILSNPKNFKYLGSNDFVDIECESFKNSTKWFEEMMCDNNIRLNFSRILSQVSLPKHEWKHKLKSVDIPTMILWGKDDKTAPVNWAYELNKLIPNSELHILEKYRHMAVMERPDFFSKLIIKFIN
ncbi:MAG: alpha/beta hydrolase [Bacillota bacterium]|nr:alpha/beta hydrolase [Bacillota bacterium]